MSNAAAAHMAMRIGARSVRCTPTRWPALPWALAIAEAAEAIASGRIDIAVAGGAESLIVPGVVRAWQALQALAQPGDDPAASCRPFDVSRSGLVLGEGAAMLVLEADEHADARAAQRYAELSGCGISCDARHMTQPDSQGQARAIQQALAQQRARAATRWTTATRMAPPRAWVTWSNARRCDGCGVPTLRE